MLPNKFMKQIHFVFICCCFPLIAGGCGSPSIKNLRAGQGKAIVVFGNSIAAGYGVKPEESFPAQLCALIQLPVLNFGVSGDTTRSALERVPDVLQQDPWIVIIELGGNDFLSKLPKEETQENLLKMVQTFQEHGSIVVLLGINLGLFKDEYKTIYAHVAKETGAFLIPQVLKGILDSREYRQDDFIHPNAKGHAKLARRIEDPLKSLLKKAQWPPSVKKKHMSPQECARLMYAH